jgi:hypothetical protein
MRAVRKLTGAFVMAALVAAALVANPAPAYADRGGPHSGEWKACTWILQAAMNMEEGSNGRYVLMSLYNAYCS